MHIDSDYLMGREEKRITVVVRVRTVHCGPQDILSLSCLPKGSRQLLQIHSGKKATDLSIGAAVPAEQPSRLQAGAA